MKKILLSVALIATGITTLNATSVADITKDALINSTSFTIAGTFGKYDFAPKGDNNKFDWAFTTSGGDVYQLRGGEASATDVFGWAKAPAGTVAPAPAWYMFQVDVDGDGTKGKFDWVLLAAGGSSAYKLDGVAADGGFAYAGPIDIDYKVDGNKITTGIAGSFDSSSSSSSSSPVTDGKSIDSAKLAGYTVVAEYKNGAKIRNIKKSSYIFLTNHQVIAVFDLYDGSRKVAHDTYHESHGNNVAIISPIFDNNEKFIPAFGISTPNNIDKITVGKSTAIYTVTSIVDNNNNDIDEDTVASSAVEGPEENPNAPMYDELNGKALMIYNNISSAAISELSYALEYNGNTRYDSSTALHCTDYGYTEVFVEGTDDGVHNKTYFLPSDSSMVCMEFDYTNATQGSGSTNVVWYKK